MPPPQLSILLVFYFPIHSTLRVSMRFQFMNPRIEPRRYKKTKKGKKRTE
jgi:hypothetical protein